MSARPVPPLTASPALPVVPRRYGATAIALHWLLALALAGNFLLGIVMTGLPLSPTRLLWFNWHKWAGATILALTLLRLLWRLGHAPPPPAPMPAWQQRAAGLAHRALYLLCLAVPLAGWAYSSAAGFPLVWFGLLPLPDWVPVDRALAESLKRLHHLLAYALAALVLLHAGAALKHQFVDHDGLLRRMWPGAG